jgi:hypothetical protein
MKRMRQPNIDAHLTVIVTDKNGKVVLRKRYKSRSFVVGFLNVLYSDFTGTVYLTAPDIVVGSGTAKPTISDTGLESQIGNGTGSGQLQYGSDSLTTPAANTNTNTGSMTWNKSFTNGSGGNVTVSEVGAYVGTTNGTYGPPMTFILHDLLPSPITLSPNQVLTVVYTITIST